MNDAQPYFSVEMKVTNLVTGEVKEFTFGRTQEPNFEPVFERQTPIEIIQDHYLYGADRLRAIDVDFKAVPYNDHGEIGIVKVTPADV